MWLEALLQAVMDVAQSEQTSRTIRIICMLLISLLFLLVIASLFLLVFVIGGPKPSQKGCLSSVGAWHPCLLPAIFEECHGQKNEGKETVIRPDIETRQTITGAFQLKFEGMGD